MGYPIFWTKFNLISAVLIPLELLFYIITKIRPIFIKSYKSKLPVICVGNITVGGSGKTPTVIFLTEFYQKKKLKVAVISRGYKSELSSKKFSVKIDEKKHSAKHVGDEPLLIHQKTGANVYIGKNRKLSVEMAQSDNCDIVIMDDGMQNHLLKKDVVITVFDGGRGIGNGMLLPAGPLREFYNPKRSDLSIIIGEDKFKLSQTLNNCINVNVEPQLKNLKSLQKKKYLAFAGIGNPNKFYKTLAENKIPVGIKMAFEDHYHYSNSDIEKLITIAKTKGFGLITTEKDLIKIPVQYHKEIDALSIKLGIYDKNLKTLEKLLTSVKIVK